MERTCRAVALSFGAVHLRWAGTCGVVHLVSVRGEGAGVAVPCTHRCRNRVGWPFNTQSVRQMGLLPAFSCTLGFRRGGWTVTLFFREDKWFRGGTLRKCVRGGGGAVLSRSWHENQHLALRKGNPHRKTDVRRDMAHAAQHGAAGRCKKGGSLLFLQGMRACPAEAVQSSCRRCRW